MVSKWLPLMESIVGAAQRAARRSPVAARLGLRCGVPPRQTQNDNDASGNPQRVAGAPRGRSYRCGITYHDPRFVKNAPTGARMALLIGELSAKLTERFLQRPVVHTLIRSTWHGFANGEQRPATVRLSRNSDAAVRRQTQSDNDASGNPQRVAGRLPRTSPTDAAVRRQT